MPKLTIKQLEALKPENDGQTFREDGGLSGKVRAGIRGVTVLFRYEFKLDGVKYDYRLGSWPKKSLADIRAARDHLKLYVAKGLNPTVAKKAAVIEAREAVAATIERAERTAAENRTVNDLFEDWLMDGVARQDGNAELKRSFAKDVLPVIGNTPIRMLTDKDLLKSLRKVKARATNRAVVILSNDLGQMLRWAERRKPWRKLMVDGNPADLIDVQKLLDHDYQEERDRVLAEDEIAELHRRFAELEQNYAALPAGKKYTGIRPVNLRVQCAVWICLTTLCRIGELLKSEWAHVDFEEATWFIPAQATKGRKGKRQAHYIFLSKVALEQFRRLQADTGSSRYCFPNHTGVNFVDCKSVSKLIGDRQIQFKSRTKSLSGRQHNNSLVLGDGLHGEWTPHDLRRTGATMMQKLGTTLDVIDRCQNHVMAGSKVRRHYLHHDYANEKKLAWLNLGEHIARIFSQSRLLQTTARPT